MAIGNNPTQQQVVAEVRRLDSAKANANAVVTDVTVNGTSVVSNGTAAVTVPTKTSDLANDNDFITVATANSTYLKKTGGGITGDLDVSGELTGGTIIENGVALSTKYTLKTDFDKVVDGTTQVGDAAKLNGQQASYYLNYNNLTNKPTIPTVPAAFQTVKDGAGTILRATDSTELFIHGDTGMSVLKGTGTNELLVAIASGYKLPTDTEWGNKQNALASQTAYTNKGNSTTVPTITTNSLGQVTAIADTSIAFENAWPSNSVYISTVNTSPGTIWANTSWDYLGELKIPLGTNGTALPVRTGGRHSGTSYAQNFDYISGSTSYQCNQTSNQNALISDGVSLTISQLNGASWGSNWGGFGTIIPNNLWANLDSDRTITLYAWKRR